jgi:two-component system response regulator RegX3
MVGRGPVIAGRSGKGAGEAGCLVVAEDDAAARLALCKGLVRYGYSVLAAADGEEALRLVASANVDLVVLDLGMPRVDGLTALARLRMASEVPVILLTGRSEERDKIHGFELGADDYVVKPYSLRELVARIRARLRTAGRAAPGPEVLVYGDLRVDSRAREVRRGGHLIELTAREYELLAFLARHPRRVFSRAELLEAVWGTQYQDPATVTEHVRRVRAKVEAPSPRRRLLTTLRGAGYRFDP